MEKSHRNKGILCFAVAWLAALAGMQSCGVEKPAEVVLAEKQLPETIDYNLHVKPILSENCFFCHGPDKNTQEAGLELATPEGAYAALKEAKDKHAIVPGKLAQSEVFHRIIATDEELMMPPRSSNRFLSAYDKAVLMKWIEQGAAYKPHWAFIKPEKSPLPKVKLAAWPRNPIDYFVLSKLEAAGLQPAKEADKETLLRRVTLDLTGLPPTVAEVDAFLADRSPRAYEKVVDRLLASPHYGEKMAVNWLDLARFADTHGYSQDSERPMWPWRDWVIKAFNANMPFDRFTTWQLAGDLLPRPSREQRLATGFNRNHAQNGEGGIVNEEYRVEYVLDRTNTLGTAFLGLTAECARCHDHKFDPLSQKDYYKLSAFFNQVDEAGQIPLSADLPVPTMLLTEARHDSLLAFLDAKIAKTEAALATTIQQEQADFAQWQQAQKGTPPLDKQKKLQAHFTFDQLVKGKFLNEASTHTGTVTDPVLAAGKAGMAFHSNGDDILQLEQVGIFSRANPFTIGCWVQIPKGLTKGVIFHKGSGDITYNFRGYYLNIRENQLELLMAHTWPYNNIVKVTRQQLPRGQWIHLAMTYDGSSKARGLKLYINGQEADLVTEKDKLYKDILFGGGTAFHRKEPNLQIGGDVRGPGFKNGLVDELYIYQRALTAPEVWQLARDPNAKGPPQAIPYDATALSAYYFANHSAAYQRHLAELEELRQQKNKVTETVPEAMVMEDMKNKRLTYVLSRGLYDAPKEQVPPGTPASVLPFPRHLPANRLGLARWLLSPDNPLTARVAVNRYWQTYFGQGLQKTSDDFGNQGSLPSHPELLDWLAVTFRESGWNVKAMQQRIVLSATYRQSSFASPALLARDPDNTLLARGPAFRLTAEMARDHALAASGLLVPKIGGPSVRPYQPEGLWAMNNAKYVPDTGEKLYRRSLYTFWKRTNPPPSMSTFDAPTRSSCVVKRQQTNTPLQTLVLLNDPQFVEAAKVVAERAADQHPNLQDRLVFTYRLLTARRPQARELDILLRLYRSEYQKFKGQPGKMKGWLQAGEYKLKPGHEQAALAAGAVVASTVMNSDAFITRR